MPRYYVGTSGWHYEHWGGGVFYPPRLPKSRWLSFYAGHFDTVELNNTFYHLPQEKTFHAWGEEAPPGFVFTLKASRFITHIRRLRDCEEPVSTFFSRALALGRERLGAVLYQTPPQMKRDDERLEAFLKLLPPGYHHTFEFRHATWFHPQVLDLLRRYGAGFCVQDMPGLECPVAVTAGHAYFRFHGVEAAYSGCYSDEELQRWAERIREAAEGASAVYVYFNNDVGGYAVENARTLRALLQS